MVEKTKSVQCVLDRRSAVKRLVKPSDLRFPIEGRDRKSSLAAQFKGTWWQRLVARHVAADILTNDTGTYQFGGYTGALRLKYELVDADRHQLAHWVLRRVGYLCCCADLMKLTGTPVV